ncbi:hypothetical protein ALC62_13288 [Cyphomyrmex costatus]|uniref:DUF4806 domain-containing protein n=1 Tax=Cyphomyrmex costatus TaxID=456900 RepID=A0A151IA48_9HYME|nr:hypothetical protein ALC62_13288 [Cyphomyrmex costatus]
MNCILHCVKLKEKRRRALQKPIWLPLSTEAEMQSFEKVNEERYEEVVDYLEYVGGFTVKEAINLAFKEVIKDSLTMLYTWFGRENGPQPLYRTRIIMAIYGTTLFSINIKYLKNCKGEQGLVC